MGSRRVGIVTSAELPALAEDDRAHLVPALEAEGLAPVPLVWTAVDARATGVDACLLRSPWDYVDKLPEFLAWIDGVSVPLWNPPALVRWNTDKRYLLELAARGVRVVPTALVGPGEPLDPAAHGWDEAVVKPAVSINGRGTRRVRAGERGVADAPTLVQPFVREVLEDGERSYVFVEGELTHAVVKRPAAGEFRVQEAHGGVALPDPTPDPARVAEARAVLAALGEAPLYARVDGVVTEGGLALMELEVTEPGLFFASAPRAASALARAVARRLA